MENENNEDLELDETEAEETENDTEEVEDESTGSDETDSDDELTRLRKENQTLKAQKAKWREKAKTKDDSKEGTPEVKAEKESSPALSPIDYMALAKADIHEDDIEEIFGYSQYRKVSVSEALKDDSLKAILEKRAEKRASAQASNTQSSRASQKKLTPSQIRANAEKGDIPERGSAEAEELFWARRGGRRKS